MLYLHVVVGHVPSAHVVPTVILVATTLQRPSYVAALSTFPPCALPGGAFLVFQGQIIFRVILRKVLSCITAFPWLLLDFILQQAKDLILAEMFWVTLDL